MSVESLGVGGGDDGENGAPINQPFLACGNVVNIKEVILN